MESPGKIPMEWLGEYSSISVACSKHKDMRREGSSGGVITSLVTAALDLGLVDAAVVVSNRFDDLKPRYVIAKSGEEVLAAAGSKYIYMGFSGLKKVLDSTKKRLVVVAQPCHIETLRNMQTKGKYKNIKFILGFFCGYNQSWDATEYLIRKAGVRPDEIKQLDYRRGPYPGGFFVRLDSGESVAFPKSAYAFVNLMFSTKQCLKCRRYLAEEGDIAVGDAWLKNIRRHSAVMVRTTAGKKLWSAAVKKGYIARKPLHVDKLIKGHAHNLRHKKEGDGFVMRIVTRFFNNSLTPRIIPFCLLLFLAKFRERFRKKAVY